MRPLSPVADLTLVGWALLEAGLRVRELRAGRGGRARDRATRALIAVSLGAAVGLALLLRSVAPGARIPTAGRALGVIVMWLGLAIRVWAIAALGRAFRTTVEVDAGQAVVTTGPYRWIRHPSYSGLLLIVAGLGLALGNWLSLVACCVVPLPAIVRRIHVEEAELERVLGDAYRVYRRTTTRLVPRLW
jgi:protein-S-isoprenylcysteine O-methyltransferase Ste14